MLELGDNLYGDGLPREPRREEWRPVRRALKTVADAFDTVRRTDGEPVPLVLVPGNHDYAGDALEHGELRDISRWYFLEELAPKAAGWRHVPGARGEFENAETLLAALKDDPAFHAKFMAPVLVPDTHECVTIAAIDSELILDFYDSDEHDHLADTYFAELESVLEAAPPGSWKLIAAHHPQVSYGKHGSPVWGHWGFGPGWPQFPELKRMLPAPTVPLGLALGLAGTGIWWPATIAPGVTAIKTFFGSRKQDVRANPYRRYAEELLRISAEHGVDAIVAGHDHNAQLIELPAPEGSEADESTLLVISGAGSKVDPARDGPGLIAYLADYSYVAMAQHPDALVFDVRDRSGTTAYRHILAR